MSHRRFGQRLAAAAVAMASSVLLASAGCGGEEPYDVTCSVDEDCVVVPTTPTCNGCASCGRTTLNRSDQQRYLEDLSEVDCDGMDISCGGTCDEPLAACADGTCALR